MANFKVTFKKVEAGYYKLFLNGVEMLQYEKGMYTWYYSWNTATDEYYELIERLPSHAQILIETEGDYITKSEIKVCWEAALKFLNK